MKKVGKDFYFFTKKHLQACKCGCGEYNVIEYFVLNFEYFHTEF